MQKFFISNEEGRKKKNTSICEMKMFAFQQGGVSRHKVRQVCERRMLGIVSEAAGGGGT